MIVGKLRSVKSGRAVVRWCLLGTTDGWVCVEGSPECLVEHLESVCLVDEKIGSRIFEPILNFIITGTASSQSSTRVLAWLKMDNSLVLVDISTKLFVIN